jgi:hypothetical protein
LNLRPPRPERGALSGEVTGAQQQIKMVASPRNQIKPCQLKLLAGLSFTEETLLNAFGNQPATTCCNLARCFASARPVAVVIASNNGITAGTAIENIRAELAVDRRIGCPADDRDRAGRPLRVLCLNS